MFSMSSTVQCFVCLCMCFLCRSFCDWSVFACSDFGYWSPCRVEGFRVLYRSMCVCACMYECLPTFYVHVCIFVLLPECLNFPAYVQVTCMYICTYVHVCWALIIILSTTATMHGLVLTLYQPALFALHVCSLCCLSGHWIFIHSFCNYRQQPFTECKCMRVGTYVRHVCATVQCCYVSWIIWCCITLYITVQWDCIAVSYFHRALDSFSICCPSVSPSPGVSPRYFQLTL